MAGLQAQVRELQARLRQSEAKVAMWEECMQALVHCAVLGPDMNDYFKDEARTMIISALKGVEQINAVKYVECSMPSVPTEAPHIQLERWDSLAAALGKRNKNLVDGAAGVHRVAGC